VIALDLFQCLQDEPPAFFWCVVPVSSTLESCPNAFDKKLVVEWLREKLHRTCSHSLRPHLFITVRRDEDVGIWQHSSVQFGLQIQAGHSRHTDIRDQARGFVLMSGLQELLT
jgi:hypothetical protein